MQAPKGTVVPPAEVVVARIQTATGDNDDVWGGGLCVPGAGARALLVVGEERRVQGGGDQGV